MSFFISRIKQTAVRIIGWPHLLRRMQLNTIVDYVERRESSRILDVGCGGGQLAYKLAGKSFVVGCDVSSVVLHAPRSENLSFLQASGLSLPFKDGSFDTVILSSVIQMIPEGQLMLREASRVLNEAGAVVLTVPTSYRYIPALFKDSWFTIMLRKRLKLPESYRDFVRDVLRRFGATGPGFFSTEAIDSMLLSEGLVAQRREYSPKAWGSLVYEFLLVFKYSFGRNLSVAGKALMTLFPVVWFDRFLPKTSVGCELVIKAGKS